MLCLFEGLGGTGVAMGAIGMEERDGVHAHNPQFTGLGAGIMTAKLRQASGFDATR